MPATAPAPLSIVPSALAAFAIGAVLLQWQAALPSAEPWLVGAALAGALGSAIRLSRRRFAGMRIAAVLLGALASVRWASAMQHGERISGSPTRCRRRGRA